MGEKMGSVKVTRMHATMMDFSICGHLTSPRGPFRAQGRADAQDCKITWLEELASERNTIQAWEDITEAWQIEHCGEIWKLGKGKHLPRQRSLGSGIAAFQRAALALSD